MTDGPSLVGLEIADPPGRWEALGFTVDSNGRLSLDAATLTLGIAPPGRGIVGWTLAGIATDRAIDGLATRPSAPGPPRPVPVAHANGAVAIDHVVVTTPDLDAFAATLEDRGLPLRRRATVRGRRMGFRRLGRPILEVVESASADAGATAFWGITFALEDGGRLDALAAANRFVSQLRPAVQPGRRIATVVRDAGLSTPVAFIDPE